MPEIDAVEDSAQKNGFRTFEDPMAYRTRTADEHRHCQASRKNTAQDAAKIVVVEGWPRRRPEQKGNRDPIQQQRPCQPGQSRSKAGYFHAGRASGSRPARIRPSGHQRGCQARCRGAMAARPGGRAESAMPRSAAADRANRHREPPRHAEAPDQKSEYHRPKNVELLLGRKRPSVAEVLDALRVEDIPVVRRV